MTPQLALSWISTSAGFLVAARNSRAAEFVTARSTFGRRVNAGAQSLVLTGW
jgi:hypothetical protein